MIAIINIDKNPRKTGWHDYEIRINKQVISTFKHRREDGLLGFVWLEHQQRLSHLIFALNFCWK